MGLFFFSFSCQTTREKYIAYYETNDYDFKGGIVMTYESMVIQFVIGVALFMIVMIVGAVNAIRDELQWRKERQDGTYEERLRRIEAGFRKDYGLDE